MSDSQENRRILYVIGTLDVGGAESHLADVSRSLVKNGWDVSIYCIAKGGPLHATLEAGRVAVYLPPAERYAPRPVYLWQRVIQRFWRELASVDLLWLMARKRPPIVHFFLPGAYIVGAPLAVLTRRPVRIMSRRSLNRYQRHSPFLRRLELRFHGWMTAVLGNSSSVIRELMEEGIPKSRLGLIYNGIDLERFSGAADTDRAAFRSNLGIAPSALVLVIVANLIPYKGHADVLAALGQAKKQLPDDWHLLVVGRDDGIGGDLRHQALRLGIESNVHFLGARTDVPEILLACDIGLLPSHEEGFSNSLLEGMAAGLPMIATDVGGNPEAIDDGITGLIVPPRDANALAAAIIRLANDRSQRQGLGDAARRRVAERFALDRCVETYDRFYRALLNGMAVQDIEQIRVPEHRSAE